MTLFPLASFEPIDVDVANRALAEWGHFLGRFDRPFGRQAFGLFVGGALVSVAVSASTINATCGGFPRRRVVELARLCSDPTASWATRVCLRLWRELAPPAWAAKYWPVEACVSYANAARHRGDVYRFDGWAKLGEVGASGAGGTWARQRGERKTVWVYVLPGADTEVR